ncbi:MAG TPA: HAD hydrolase family protein [Terracidiphilus sp.]|nr:HAD hydrolase family protein [Terracidiphilus sp.]
MGSAASNSNLARIRGIALDVDGVLTDGGVWWGSSGEEWKRFCFADIMGISLAQRAGIQFALVSGEDSPLVDRFAGKMHIRHVFRGCRDKASALLEFSGATGITLGELSFMGDDVNDLPAMEIAGFSAAPANAVPAVIERAGFVAAHGGGNGAVREWVDAILAARGIDPKELFLKPRAEAAAGRRD